MKWCHDCGGPGTLATPLILFQITFQQMPTSDPDHWPIFSTGWLCPRCAAELRESLTVEKEKPCST